MHNHEALQAIRIKIIELKSKLSELETLIMKIDSLGLSKQHFKSLSDELRHILNLKPDISIAEAVKITGAKRSSVGPLLSRLKRLQNG